MKIAEVLSRVIDRHDLTRAEAEEVLDQIMTGQWTDAQIGALLTALRMKGESVDEITGFAAVMRRRAHSVQTTGTTDEQIGDTEREALIDTCGTGGDAAGTFNVSTATALVVAGCGLRVAKHGNRSASSQCGSADVVEALGVRIDLSPERIAACIDQVGIGFLPAPMLHEAMKHVAPARRQLGVRTIFNLLGPLTNPARANVQVIGVYAPQLTRLAANALRELGTRRALVVHGHDGLDELTITGPTSVTELDQGSVRDYTITPEEAGLERASIKDIQGGDAERNAEIIREVLDGRPGAKLDIVLLNASAALVAAGKASGFKEGAELAADSIRSGKAREKLRLLIEFTNRN